MAELCIVCGEREIAIKKYGGHCGRCYNRLHQRTLRGDKNGLIELKKVECINWQKEMDFAKNFFDHKNWIYEPARFRLNDNETYKPDFYDGERNVFIEVAGTKQAFSAGMDKYKKFIKTFPRIKFEIRNCKGTLIDANGKYHEK